MTKPLFANEKVMMHYLDALLQEDTVLESTSHPVENLLSDVEKVAEHHKSPQPITQEKADTVEPVADAFEDKFKHKEVTAEPTPSVAVKPSAEIIQLQSDTLDDQFQALYFEVAGLTLAVPLNSLGGIYQVNEINRLMGKPDWFSGVMLYRDEKLSVVDTARWVMPEKYNKKLEEALDYQYLIVLGNSQWGLLAERLVDNVSLQHQDIKWRDNRKKRPWLAGLIKDKMCALIDVSATKSLLEQGLDSKHDD